MAIIPKITVTQVDKVVRRMSRPITTGALTSIATAAVQP